ncbi:hypothetical protein AB0L62_21790 [Nocardia asteroides]|uniref:hypothetical protein n=1 Tax=Nocardia asteroides TaxID=1824 RepID=UPI00342F0111
MTDKPEGEGFRRIAGLAGIGFALVIVGANLVLVPAGLPKPGTDPDQAVAFFQDNRDLVASALAPTPLAWFCAVLFGAGVLATLRSAERDTGTGWSLAGFAGLLLQNATFTVIVGLRYALATEAGVVPALWVLQDALLALNGTFLALALVGFTYAGRLGGLLRPWHVWVGFLAAAPQFAAAVLTPWVIDGPGALGFVGLSGWLLWVVWFVAYGIALIRGAPSGGQEPAHRPAIAGR